MKMIDMFCGGGGMGLGFKQAGWEIVQSFDIDKYAVQMYQHNVEEHVTQSDITQLKGADVKDADLWTFGFPCQDLSIAGKQAGLFEGKRSGLFFEVMRLLDEVPERPKFVLAENVKQLKQYLPTLKEEFNKRGYVMSYRLYNSKYWGVPQNRERYFVMGIQTDVFEKGKPYYPVQVQDFVPTLSSILENKVDEKYYLSDEKAQSIIQAAIERLESKKNPKGLMDVFTDKDGAAYCCDANYAKGVSPNFTGTGRRTHIIEHGTCIDTRQHKDGVRLYDELACTITSTCYKEPKLVVVGELDKPNWKRQWKTVYGPEGISPTLVCSGGGQHEPKILDNLRVRKLTPREYARLQGFSDNYELIVSDTQAYKIFGNAVTVNVAKAIAEVLLNATHHRK